MIDIIDVTKQFGTGAGLVNALNGITLRIEPGEFVAVVGPSGSGKSTLLDVAGLLLRPTSGKVLIDGADMSAMGDRRRARIRARQLGFVFQEYNLLPTLTAVENVMLPLQYGAVRANGRRRALELLSEVGLEGPVAGRRPDQLSGGQRQRVAIARSLICEPRMVLADEPTGALDTANGDALVALMRRLNQARGVTFVIVTHDLDLAGTTNRVIRLRDGRVAADGPPQAKVA
jgi:putative ABC transport system ATP-binding protein